MGMYRGMRPLWDVIHLHWVFSFFTPCIYQEMVTYFSSYSRRRRQPSACLKSESVKFNLFAENIFSFRNLLSQFMIYLLFAWAKLYLLCVSHLAAWGSIYCPNRKWHILVNAITTWYPWMAHYPIHTSLVNITIFWYKYLISQKVEYFCLSSDTFAQTIWSPMSLNLKLATAKMLFQDKGWQLICGHLPQNSVTISHYTVSCHPDWQRTEENATFRREEIQLETRLRNAGHSSIWGGCHEQKCMRI